MDERTVRKVFKYKLKPTPEQERALAFVVRRCCELYNAALEERKVAWEKRGVSVTAAVQSAQLPGLKEVRPEYCDIHSQVLQDVLTRLDRAFQAFFRRAKNGEMPGYPRFQGSNRYHSFTYKQFGNGATLADGTRILTPACYRKAERHLKRLQRRVSRRKPGSHRRRKAVRLLARAHLKVKRQRQDFHHKVALTLVRQHDTIYHEALQTANLLKNHHLAKSIGDAGWSQFLSLLSFKAACAGRSVVAVPPAYTSQACSGCGVLVSKGLSVRWHCFPDCGASLHRDHNAAMNIQRFGQNLRGAVA
jgi:IS605 OrfB family transposase